MIQEESQYHHRLFPQSIYRRQEERAEDSYQALDLSLHPLDNVAASVKAALREKIRTSEIDLIHVLFPEDDHEKIENDHFSAVVYQQLGIEAL